MQSRRTHKPTETERLLTILAGRTACLDLGLPTGWKRRFPVLGAVPAILGTLAVILAVVLLTAMLGASAVDFFSSGCFDGSDPPYSCFPPFRLSGLQFDRN